MTKSTSEPTPFEDFAALALEGYPDIVIERKLGISRKQLKQAAYALVQDGWYFNLPYPKQVRINSYQVKKQVKLCRQHADAWREKIDHLGIGDLA